MGMFDGGVGMFGGGFVGANTGGGFVGARQGGGMSAQSYLQWEAARQEQQREEAMKRRLLRQDQQNTDREMTLKERLAQSQMDDSAASQALARDRLGLDANTASNDANQRANALSLQERLGWAGENRMSNADQQQNERANQQLSLQERLGLMSEGRLARGQDQDEAFRRAQLGQQAQLAQLPYQQQTADSAAQSQFQNRQLGQQDKQFNRQFTDMPLADRWRNQLAEKQQMLDQSNTDRAFNDLSARDRQTGSLEEKRMGLTERLAGNENQLRRDLQGETLKQQLQMWSGLSAAEKQQNKQFGQSLAQRLMEFKSDTEQRGLDRGQRRWEHETESGSGAAARINSREMFDEGQAAENWREAGRQVQADEDRKSREKMHGESVTADKDRTIAGILPDLVNDRQFGPQARVVLQRILGLGGPEQSSRGAAELGTMVDQRLKDDQNIALGGAKGEATTRAPSSLDDVKKIKASAAKTLFELWKNEGVPLHTGDAQSPGIFERAASQDESHQLAPGHTRQTLQELLKQWQYEREQDPYRPHGSDREPVWAKWFRKPQAVQSVPYAMPQF